MKQKQYRLTLFVTVNTDESDKQIEQKMSGALSDLVAFEKVGSAGDVENWSAEVKKLSEKSL